MERAGSCQVQRRCQVQQGAYAPRSPGTMQCHPASGTDQAQLPLTPHSALTAATLHHDTARPRRVVPAECLTGKVSVAPTAVRRARVSRVARPASSPEVAYRTEAGRLFIG